MSLSLLIQSDDQPALAFKQATEHRVDGVRILSPGMDVITANWDQIVGVVGITAEQANKIGMNCTRIFPSYEAAHAYGVMAPCQMRNAALIIAVRPVDPRRFKTACQGAIRSCKNTLRRQAWQSRKKVATG